jgi:hypothetical protein
MDSVEGCLAIDTEKATSARERPIPVRVRFYGGRVESAHCRAPFCSLEVQPAGRPTTVANSVYRSAGM